MSQPIHVVWHCAAMGHWKHVAAEQLQLLADSDLTEVDCTFVGTGSDWLKEEALSVGVNLNIVRQDENLLHYETFAMLHIEELAETTDKPILYFHTKGVSHHPDDKNKIMWRRVMEEHVVRRWRQNLPYLRTHDAVGVNWFSDGEQHFSGTFWMANADWIRRLPDYASYHAHKDYVRFSCEMWIGAVGSGCKAKSLVCQNEHWWYDDYDFTRWMPKPLHFVQLLTRNYLKKGIPSLDSAANLKTAERHLVCYKFEPTDYLKGRYPHFELHHLPPTPFESFNMVQGGQFLDALPAMNDDELVILADADILIQRDFTAQELQQFDRMDGKTLALAWNAHDKDNLHEEAGRIGMTAEDWMKNVPCYNCGVIVGRVSAWKKLRAEFEKDAIDWYSKSDNRCRIQWVICNAIRRAGLRVAPLSLATHAHGHFELAPGVTPDGKHLGDTVLFRHRF